MPRLPTQDLLCGFTDRHSLPIPTSLTPKYLLPGELALFTSRTKLGFYAALAVVLLRVGIGIHFYQEGLAKLSDPKPFSAGFLGNAKGPLAPLLKSMVWDADGKSRLDVEATEKHWQQFYSQIVSHYRLDADQTADAEKVLTDHLGRLKNFLDDHAGDIEDYSRQLTRRDLNAADPARSALDSLKAHDARITGDWMPIKGKLLSGVDGIWKSLDSELNAIAAPEQWKAHGRIKVGKVGTKFGDSETVDSIIPYFDLIVGLLLIFGLCVRPAAVAAGLFLLSVCASQWPGSAGAAPIYYQAIEMLALFQLAVLGAGYWAGVDGIISKGRGMCCPPQKAGS